jgi:hypothetical protein
MNIYKDICKRILKEHYIGDGQVVATESLHPFLIEIVEAIKNEKSGPVFDWKDKIGMSDHAKGEYHTMMMEISENANRVR